MSVKILDCTLRDGGYYNLWKFPILHIKQYLNQIHKSKVDIVEVGFRFLERSQSLGQLAYTEEKYLNKLKFYGSTKYSVMLNGSDLLSDPVLEKISRIFVIKKKSNISIVRIAVQYEHIFQISKHINFLKRLGYQIAINLMQIHKINEQQLEKFLIFLKKLNIKIFYFADTFGVLKPENVKKICSIIKKNWSKEFGIHAHDNSGFALANTIEALNNGAKFLDCTMLGMGRGAGNVATETLITELNARGIKKYLAQPIYSLATGFFQKYKKRYNWGSSIYYHLAAIKNIHPSYIQELLFDNRYNHDEIIKIILNLSKKKNIYSYNPNIVKEINYTKAKKKINNIDKNWSVDKNILIIGQGKSVDKNRIKISKLIRKKKCLVLSLNVNKFFPLRLVDYCIVSDGKRFSLDQHQYKKIKKVILPVNQMFEFMNEDNKNYFNYDMNLKKNTFNISQEGCILPNRLAIGYALALCKFGNAKNIYLVGFDGYEDNDELNIKMTKYFEFLQKKTGFKIKFISKTLYKK
jgi:4-hydroxy 2-oxovalerate aldolase